MDTDFFRSKYFLVAAVVAALLVGGAAAAYLTNDGMWDESWAGNEDGCDARTAAGSALAATTRNASEPERRTLTWTLNASTLDAGLADLCVAVGELLVQPSPDDLVRVEARIRADTQGAVDATRVEVVFAQQGSRLNVAAYESKVGQTRTFFGGDGAAVTLIVQLPARGAWDLDLATAVGDLRASDLLVGNVTAHASVGEVRVVELDLVGDAKLETSVGSIILDLRSVQTGTIVARADVDDVEISLPTRADVGYDVTAHASVGEVDVRIGETETYTSRGGDVGDDVHAVSKGYAAKPTQVVIDASADVGDITVVAGTV